MKNTTSILLAGVALTTSLALPARAEKVNSHAVAADPGAHTITTLEARRRYVFTITEKTRFVDAKGTLLAVGLKAGDDDVLAVAIQKGYLKEGARLTIDFAQVGDQLPALQVQFRDMTRAPENGEKNPQPGDGAGQ